MRGELLEPLTSDKYPMLLFIDGDCSFCNRWAARVKKADRMHRIRFSTRQGPTFQRVASVRPDLARIESVVLAFRQMNGEENFYTRSTAIRKVVDGLPGFRLFAWILHLVPTPVSDLGYWIFSKLREPLFSRWHDVRVPIERDQELYLD